MGRWRPPRPKSSAYITAAGARALTAELRELWKVERPKVTEVVHEAAKNGDRSENGDYIYGKKRLREIDSRVRFLTKRLESLTIVDRLPSDQSRVLFGAWVTLEDDDGVERCYQIVGPDEFNINEGKISMDSPLAQAMLKKQVDDEVMVRSADNEKNYYISAIEYKPYD
ncbi:transcription elongation factor GreB [Gilvimarinus polysaccharolyticus]|uniref:transcription elongation factor GreB n=1 Tax=Gilvimarinus polysaccharolyticus TaxID=863921 RepID=UPI000673C557|nr:transcription elongation factor GreB [Gilvimarinus polysaccharolyticus]